MPLEVMLAKQADDRNSYLPSSLSKNRVDDPLPEESYCKSHGFHVIASSHVITNDKIQPATIVFSSSTGKIISIYDCVLPRSYFDSSSSSAYTFYKDYTPNIILPGLVDTHVHLNEPGRTEWEGFYTGTRAAASGGVTTLVDMPLNAIPPTTTVKNLHEKMAAARGKCWVDVGFWGGIVPSNAGTGELKMLVKEGVRGFKCFLIDSGVEEFPALGMIEVERALRELDGENSMVLFHAEMLPRVEPQGELDGGSNAADFLKGIPTVPEASLSEALDKCDPMLEYSSFVDSRPGLFETTAIEAIISRANIAPSLPLHIVHLSSAAAIPILRQAQDAGVNITAETCTHYLCLAAEEVPPGDTRFKCCPPIRERNNQDQLWIELLKPDEAGVIHMVVSDHSPCTPELKKLPDHLTDPKKNDVHKSSASTKSGDFATSWGGISSVGLTLPSLWTELTRRGLTSCATYRNASLLNIARWCCANTAKQAGLEDLKGAIKVGSDADFAIFDTEASWVVERTGMLFRNKCSPYEGRMMRGLVRETWLRGRRVFVSGREEGGFGAGNEAEGCLLVEPRKGLEHDATSSMHDDEEGVKGRRDSLVEIH